MIQMIKIGEHRWSGKLLLCRALKREYASFLDGPRGPERYECYFLRENALRVLTGLELDDVIDIGRYPADGSDFRSDLRDSESCWVSWPIGVRVPAAELSLADHHSDLLRSLGEAEMQVTLPWRAEDDRMWRETGADVLRIRIPDRSHRDLSFLPRLRGLRSLSVASAWPIDIGPVGGCEHLQDLTLHPARIAAGSRLCLRALPDLVTADVPDSKRVDIRGSRELKRLTLRSWKSRDLSGLGGTALSSLTVIAPRRLRSLDGLGSAAGSLQRFFVYGAHLTDISSIASWTGIETLDFSGSTVEVAVPNLANLARLKSLSFGPGKLDSLAGLLGLPALQELSIVLTSVLDGKMLPLASIQSLRRVMFTDTYHYDATEAEIQRIIDQRNAP